MQQRKLPSSNAVGKIDATELASLQTKKKKLKIVLCAFEFDRVIHLLNLSFSISDFLFFVWPICI